MDIGVIAVANQKGGVGKTTIAMNMAAGLSRRGSCIVVDADPQRSASMWVELSDSLREFPAKVVPAEGKLKKQIIQLQTEFDYIVIDCPPEIKSDSTMSAMEISQVLLIPLLPSPMDLWASTRIEELIKRVQRVNPTISAFVVLNQIEPRSAMSRGMDEALQEINIPVLRHRLSRRASYRTAALEGCSVYDLGFRGRVASKEIDNIINEVLVQ
ncbi:MAG: cobyrinic acid a,c-diamide synthase [Nitrosomonadales bacterium]|jgi:chromosome partitioning protein|nr:MAG: cobyrinic acid a,c-diamide synthase [Nitrosomonadales bacterium]